MLVIAWTVRGGLVVTWTVGIGGGFVIAWTVARASALIAIVRLWLWLTVGLLVLLLVVGEVQEFLFIVVWTVGLTVAVVLLVRARDLPEQVSIRWVTLVTVARERAGCSVTISLARIVICRRRVIVTKRLIRLWVWVETRGKINVTISSILIMVKIGVVSVVAESSVRVDCLVAAAFVAATATTTFVLG